MEKILIITVKAVPVIIIKKIIIKRILVALKYKKGNKDRYYIFY